jgi:hypothetical protein
MASSKPAFDPVSRRHIPRPSAFATAEESKDLERRGLLRTRNHNTDKPATVMKMTVKNAKGKTWIEDYTEIIDDPEKFCRDMIDFFNRTLRPGESRRYFVKVEVVGEVAPPEHRWMKLTAMTQQRGDGTPFDQMKCERCGITGKRYGIQGHVSRDSKFRARVYARCDSTIEHLRKKGATTSPS